MTSTDDAGPSPKFRPVRALVRLAGSVALLTILFSSVDMDGVWAAIKRTSPDIWLLSLFAFLTLHVLSAAKWRFFLSLCGARLPLTTAVQCYAAGLFANLCMPSLVGGDVIRATLAIRASGESAPVLLGSIVDRLVDLLALGLLVGAGLVVAPGAAEELHGGVLSAPVVLSGLVALSVASIVALRVVLARLPLRRLPRHLARLTVKMLRALKALFSRPNRGLIGLSACLTLQAGFVALNIPLGQMVGLELDVRLWFLLWPLAKVAAMTPLSIGGLGVREGAFAVLVGPFAAPELAVAESLVWQSILISGGIIAGVYSLWSNSRTHKISP